MREEHRLISKLSGFDFVWRHCSMLQTRGNEGFLHHSCVILLCVQWPQPGPWLHSHQTFVSVAITNYRRANFSKAGPISNCSLFDSRDCTCTCSPTMGVKATTDRTSEIIFLEETTYPTDLNGAAWQMPDICIRLMGLRRKDLQFCCPIS